VRTFIHYDQNGEIVSVAKVEVMPEHLEHPFTLTEEAHGVLELDPEDPLAEKAGGELIGAYSVDVKSKRLRKAPKEPAAAAKESGAARESEASAGQPKQAEEEARKPAAPDSPKPKPQPKLSKPGGGQR
jgi:hypothetical protein